MNSTLVCVTCGKAFHSSCATRDWKERVKLLGKTKLICADHGGQYPVADLTDNGDEKEVEIVYLKLLMDVLKSKNKILKENNPLLREKVGNLEERIKKAEKESKSEVKEKAINNIDKIESEDLINKLLNTGVLTGDWTVNGLYDATNPDKESSDNALPWTEVVHRKGQNQKTKAKLLKSVRPEPLRGSNNSVTVLKPAIRMSFLFVSGFSPEVTCEAVLNYLKECGLNDYVTCGRMKTKEKYKISFKLAVPLNV
ncbi:hypothetical protein WA026_008960 [Henosepilachna vigintioctopunctata]|uniref:Zinc finger PHD-type domain-containing protein n=1 Tax=Henosepilachna vigintioctopunctata TaxID=420089 RepID=A0AAW1VAJ8_9CUCU